MLPPPLAVIAHGKLSYYTRFKFGRRRLNYIVQPLRRLVQPVRSNTFTCFAFGVVAVACFVSLLFEASGTFMTRLRNFDTEPPSSYCYEFQPDNRLESVANAHTAADLHVRPVSQTALVSRAVGVAND
jgi:hypothetical protein